jgi:hypothetical protein
MDRWNADAALKLVDEIDTCVIDLLPSNLSPNTTASSAEGTRSNLKCSNSSHLQRLLSLLVLLQLQRSASWERYLRLRRRCRPWCK